MVLCKVWLSLYWKVRRFLERLGVVNVSNEYLLQKAERLAQKLQNHDWTLVRGWSIWVERAGWLHPYPSGGVSLTLVDYAKKPKQSLFPNSFTRCPECGIIYNAFAEQHYHIPSLEDAVARFLEFLEPIEKIVVVGRGFNIIHEE